VSLAPAECDAIAERLVRARFDDRALAAFPGLQPNDLDTAYRIQDAAIARWHDRLVGWKIGGIPPEQQASLGATRLMGPVFAGDLRLAVREREVRFPVYDGGFAAVEAEIVFRLAVDPPLFDGPVTAEQALACVDAVFAGVETAGSPMAAINRLGATAVVSDFGNNHGLILGPRIDCLGDPWAPIECHTLIDGERVGQEHLADGLRGPAQALAFAFELAATRRWRLRSGDYVTTGALTGIHDILPGQRAEIDFAGVERIVCRAMADASAPERPA
jgi:2-keto-4-pentenoate hydratase